MKKGWKFNPVWIAILTFWLPYTLSRLSMPEIIKMGSIWIVVISQLYFLYIGIEMLRGTKK